MSDVVSTWFFEPLPESMRVILPVQVLRTDKPLPYGQARAAADLERDHAHVRRSRARQLTDAVTRRARQERRRDIELLEAYYAFPGDFSLSVIARNDEAVTGALSRPLPPGARHEVKSHERQPSSGGKYVSHRLKVRVRERRGRARAVRRLRAIDGVKTVALRPCSDLVSPAAGDGDRVAVAGQLALRRASSQPSSPRRRSAAPRGRGRAPDRAASRKSGTRRASTSATARGMLAGGRRERPRPRDRGARRSIRLRRARATRRPAPAADGAAAVGAREQVRARRREAALGRARGGRPPPGSGRVARGAGPNGRSTPAAAQRLERHVDGLLGHPAERGQLAARHDDEPSGSRAMSCSREVSEGVCARRGEQRAQAGEGRGRRRRGRARAPGRRGRAASSR